MKNLSTNTVFYFVIPIDFETLLVSGAVMDVPGFAAAWKGLDETTEVSVVIKGIHSRNLFLSSSTNVSNRLTNH